MHKIIIKYLFILTIFIAGGCSLFTSKQTPESSSSSKIDDWKLSIEESSLTKSNKNASNLNSSVYGLPQVEGLSSFDTATNTGGNLGFAVGGANDINNFRQNIKNDFLPLKEDITYEGIFYDYFFSHDKKKEASHLFEPVYNTMTSTNPLTNEEEIFLSLGLTSNLSQADFSRKKLNLTIVLDISGSMSSSFNKYYYDGEKRIEFENFNDSTKIEIAKEAIIDLTKRLGDGDRLSIVLYNHQAILAKPFNLIESTDMDAIRGHIAEISAGGATNMYAGLDLATKQYSQLPEYDNHEYDNRIIFLTDAMPNIDITSENSIWGLMKVNAEHKIYTTFIGIGIDLNNQLINYISRTPGANYYSVHNANDFKLRMDHHFEYMVTPLVFDLNLYLKSDSYEIDQVYGSPEASFASGQIMRVNTLFPSETVKQETRGGIILLKLRKTSPTDQIDLICSYKDRNGIPTTVKTEIRYNNDTQTNKNSIRKAILLSRYVNLIHDWLDSEIELSNPNIEDDWQYKKFQKHLNKQNNTWERHSTPLFVNEYYSQLFARFTQHFAQEATLIEDQDLRQELDILEKLSNKSK